MDDLEARFAAELSPLTDEQRARLLQVLYSDRLEHGEPTAELVSLLVRNVVEDMSDEQYLAEVLRIANRPHGS
jgi:hypothetical protein